jgi:hypothetical protein
MRQVTRSPRPKPARSARLSRDTGVEGARRILTLFIGREAFTYWLSPLASDFGQGFRLEKFTDGVQYDVHLGDDGSTSCECKGALRWGHCKHTESILALRQAGRLAAKEAA